MEHVSERTSNPFGMAAPCEPAVYGYGDTTADFHVIGSDPETHGGIETGVPFTGSEAGGRLQSALAETGLVRTVDDQRPVLENCYFSYLHVCPTGPALERFCDAELRAINAHILLPVGRDPLAYVLREFTTRPTSEAADPAALHATEIRGRGFLVVPVAEPTTWTPADRKQLIETLRRILASDYRQTKGVATTIG